MRDMDRRQLLGSVLALAGVAPVSPALAKVIFEGPASLPADLRALLTAVADTIIPRTDTPGAVQAGVPAQFEKLLANWASSPRREEILAALRSIEVQSGQKFGASFPALNDAQRFELLSAFDKTNAAEPGYSRLKSLLVTLYYLSEVGATVELRYEHAPGAWEPSIPVTAETRNYGGPSI